jgi:hypothetical protein
MQPAATICCHEPCGNSRQCHFDIAGDKGTHPHTGALQSTAVDSRTHITELIGPAARNSISVRPAVPYSFPGSPPTLLHIHAPLYTVVCVDHACPGGCACCMHAGLNTGLSGSILTYMARLNRAPTAGAKGLYTAQLACQHVGPSALCIQALRAFWLTPHSLTRMQAQDARH